jgi:hypothetical protein
MEASELQCVGDCDYLALMATAADMSGTCANGPDARQYL